MDVERVTGELYALRPSEFTAARDAYVAEARRAKDKADARAIAALRRPPLAVWAANLPARERPEEAARFLALGEAHRTLDGERLREAGRQRHRLVAALVRTAAALAEEAGHPVSDPVLGEVEQILHAVLARPEVAGPWAKGRLTTLPETAVGFPAVPPEALAARTPAAPPGPRTGARRKGPALTRDEQGKGEKAETAKAEEAERARAAAGEARTVLARRERERDAARETETAARTAAEEAAERLRRAEREREEAAEAAAVAERTAGETGAALRTAEQALDGARDAVARAEKEVRRHGRAER